MIGDPFDPRPVVRSVSACLRGHAGRLDDSFEYDDDLEVFVSWRQIVGADVPQWTGLSDAVLDDDGPDEEQSTLVISLFLAVSEHQLTLVDR